MMFRRSRADLPASHHLPESMWEVREIVRLPAPVRLVALLLATVMLVVQTASAQTAQVLGQLAESGNAGSDAEVSALPEPLTRQAIRDVLSGLSDGQARELLLKELDQQVAAREAELAAAEEHSIGALLGEWGMALGRGWVSAIQGTPAMAGSAAATLDTFQSRRGDASQWRLAGTLVLCLLLGLAAAIGVHRMTRKAEARLFDHTADSLWSRIGLISGRFMLQGARLLAFVVGALVVNALVNRSIPPDSSVVRFVVGSIGWTWFAVMAARFVLSPARPDLRLCTVDDGTAWFLTRRIGLIFGWSAFAGSVFQLAWQFGWPVSLGSLAFWISLVFHGLMALTIWQARTGISRMVLGHADSGPAWHRFAELWPTIAIAMVAFQWLVVELFGATGNLEHLSVAALNISLSVLLALPLLELAIRAVVEAIWPDDSEESASLRAAHRETQLGLMRCGRTITAVVLILVLARIWGLDLKDLASQGVGAQLAGAMVEIFLIGIVAYGVWELLEIVSSRQIAIERAVLGIDDDGEEQPEGEGGRGGTRLGTIMPLIRGTGQVIIVTLAVLAVLGQIGVNVTPLLAGAGIIGVAIGFGAQTLVRDIISGVFFLIDDAFRRGEYIDIGTVAGTVENISIRSMQLRHHNGPLNTIPFGEIRHLTNFSRDWVMMKLPLRVTYDTDVERLRKLIKRLGQDLLDDPELGPKFLQPLKSQGVIQMEDSAMIIRVKFMTRPGDQWALRTKVFARIRELFEREGIKFAHREVTVRIADQEAGQPLREAEKEAVAAAARSAIELPETVPSAPRDDR